MDRCAQRRLVRGMLDGIPVLCAFPEEPNGRLALWMPYFGGTKEDGASTLRRFARAGFVGVGIDPWQHGDRATSESPGEFSAGVFAAFRSRMWPILGRTTLDAMRIIDWADELHGVGSRGVVAFGVSMGGDIAVSLAGADRRVTRIAAIGSSPDWTRPGMEHVDRRGAVIDQGVPSVSGQWFYDRFDPVSHLGAYARGFELTFEVGAEDTHVPPAGAATFFERLEEEHPCESRRIRIIRHPGLDHTALVQSVDVRERTLDWLLAPEPGSVQIAL